MRRLAIPVALAAALTVGCAARPDKATPDTLAELRHVRPDVEEATIEQGLDQAMEGYRRFLEETPETEMTPEAMRRLADLQIEKQFGLRAGDGKPREMAAPEAVEVPIPSQADTGETSVPAAIDSTHESDREFEERTTAMGGLFWDLDTTPSPAGVSAGEPDPAGPLEAVALYDRLLTEYPDYEHRDKVLYQKARAYDELGRTEEAIQTMERLIAANPHSEHFDEVQFRRGEYFFTRRRFLDAEEAYATIIDLGDSSSYYELALYKLGWTLYKQELYEDALHRYMALLDYRVSIGYDFDQAQGEEDERRVADTYRVISLSFSNLGGPEAAGEYFSTFGNRSYEDRIYAHLGEHYLAKLRYDDAAKTYRSFVAMYPFHRSAPQFSMRVVETFTKGGFPKLVLEAKRDFASTYGLRADYWRHFTPEDSPEVMGYLKANLKDLANHYHAEYQDTEEPEDKIPHYREALVWYGDYLDSFPEEAESPGINYQLADLHLEHEDFGQAAREYERTAYGYPAHEQSAAAGYAAVYAYREQLKTSTGEQEDDVKRATIASSIRFADTFPGHEHAATILGAAADDMYGMKNYPAAVEAAQRVIDDYPEAETTTRRSAWVVVAHGSFDLADYPRAELAYGKILSLTPEDDESHADIVDNLAASIYKQAERANEAEDYRAAATHFLRIRSAAPTSTIRPSAEFDAGVALMALEDWPTAASVLDTFRRTYPDHELRLEATRLIANAYRQDGQTFRAADEYDRIASESDDPGLRSDALLVAGDLYEQSEARDRAIDVYTRYVCQFPEPIETALETRFKIAELHQAGQDSSLYHQELARIVSIEAGAGRERTARTRTLAARSALVMAGETYKDFVAVRLLQPFEVSLQKKQKHLDATIDAMGRLVDYEIADVTAAATFYMAETYFEFSRALADSERPDDLEPTDLELYEIALEEEAFPFEEKAIDLHEENLEMLQEGVFNAWTEKSLGKLAEMMPGRYAKYELSSGFLLAIDSYVYESPVSQVYGPVLPVEESLPAEEDAAPADESAPTSPPKPTSRLDPPPAEEGVTQYARPW